MIGYIKGVVEEIGSDYIILENNGIGYKLFASLNTISNIEKGQDVKIFSKMIVREDDISLCGFFSKEEEEMFNLLTSVSKIGTKVGMGILSFANPAKLKRFIVSADIKNLSKAPGVGKKTAERIVLELKDKVSKFDILDDVEEDFALPCSVQDNTMDEAVEALMALGYSSGEATEAVSFVKQPAMTVEDIIKKSLEYIAKNSFK